MDTYRILFLVAVVVSASKWKSETTKFKCIDLDLESFNLLEGEGFYFVPYAVIDPNLPDANFTWYKNGSQIENITSDEKDRIHYHGAALFFFNLQKADSGNYIARRTTTTGQCFSYRVKIDVVNPDRRASEGLLYGDVKDSDINKKVMCPEPAKYPCDTFKGHFTWFKDFELIPGKHDANLWVYNASTADRSIFTCICTWTHNNKVYNSSASRRIIALETAAYRKVTIISPTDKEQYADEGSGLKLNCSVFCGTNAERECNASWHINDVPVRQNDRYIQTTTLETNKTSKNTISTAILAINKVSAKDFQDEFKCVGMGFYTADSVTLTLKQRDSIIPLIIGGVCVLLFCVFAAVLVKCFAVDLALFFRSCCPHSRHNKDMRLYDAYVVYQTDSLDKVTEDRLSLFITKILPSVLENKCGYRLFIHGRDDTPGEDHLELVEDCMKQSRRLMVILTPDSGSASEITDQHLASPQTSVIGGFDWQVGLHHALVQRELSVILIQLGETGPQGYTNLPPSLQHLIRKSAPLRWPEGSRGAATWNSRFWKRVRYLMPATPAKKCALSSMV